jgi:eukaryotic-like serine/threonine-protein kinase
VRFCPVDGAQISQGGATDDRNLGRTLLGQFEILDVCGRGAMGAVYRAHQRTMDRIVAVKILRRELLQEPDVVKRFVREARAAAKLQHPNIVTVHMVGETDDKLPFLVMEYVDGVSLESALDGGAPLGLSRSVRVARQIASALEEAHSGGIIHRDLKPANILLYGRGNKTDLVKVLDFGIAKIVQPDGAGESILTRDGMIFGTPHYIAPEQATGNDVDSRADLYSLGVILFRMVTGRLPFEGTAGMQVVLRHLREPPPQPRALNPQVPVALETLVLNCLAKDRTQRPASAEAILTELTWIEEALPPEGTAAPAANGTGKVKIIKETTSQVRRNVAPQQPGTWRKRAAAAGVAVAIAGGTAFGVLLARSRNPAPPPAPLPIAIVAPEHKPVVTPLVLSDEHVLREGGLTLRAGFERPLAPGETALTVILDGATGPGRAEVTLAPAHAHTREQTSQAMFLPEEKRFRSLLTLDGGKEHLRVVAHAPGRAAALVLAFDLDVPSGTPVAARPDVRRPRPADKGDKGDDLPVTFVPADPKPPRAVMATPRPPAKVEPLPPARSDTPPPPENAAYPTTKVVIEHPKPIKPPQNVEPPPAPEQPAEDPPSRPNDPTTLPPPTPDETR